MSVSTQKIEMIVAVDKNGGFGKNGKIPWHYPEDFRHFKETTKGAVVIMGRLTYEDLLSYGIKNNEVLPGRICIVVGRGELSTLAHNVLQVDTLLEALNGSTDFPERRVFIIGGERLFREGLEYVDVVHMTHINKDFECDRFFPMKELRIVGEGCFQVSTLIDSGEHDEISYAQYWRSEEAYIEHNLNRVTN